MSNLDKVVKVKRKCSQCGKVKPCRSNSTCKDGAQLLCVRCNRGKAAEWYADNREAKLEYQREYYLLKKKIGRSNPRKKHNENEVDLADCQE